ncbi:hypothetical protein N9767_01225 [Planktomarina temperata]|nr:hypothetical protein [Planktomarina temperata]
MGKNACMYIPEELDERLEGVRYKSLFIKINNICNHATHIYTRSIFDFLCVYFIKIFRKKKYKIIHDFRGLISEESFMRNQSKYRRSILRYIEKFVYNRADILHAVSFNLETLLTSQESLKRKMSVIPCCCEWRPLPLKKSSFKDLKFVYAGSLAEWQNFDDIIEIYKSIEKIYENTSLTVLTFDIEQATMKINEHNLRNFFVKFVQHDYMQEELSKYDFGFLIRKNNIVNTVSSPIKFMEYLNAGVIPIMTPFVGDYSNLGIKRDLAIVYENIDSVINEVSNEKSNIQRQLNINKFCHEFTWASMVDRINW